MLRTIDFDASSKNRVARMFLVELSSEHEASRAAQSENRIIRRDFL
jgi:hypothetical protein